MMIDDDYPCKIDYSIIKHIFEELSIQEDPKEPFAFHKCRRLMAGGWISTRNAMRMQTQPGHLQRQS